MEEREISIELSHSLREWGYNLSTERNFTFAKQVVETALDWFRWRGEGHSQSMTTLGLRCIDFPSSIDRAFEHYLRKEDVLEPIYCYTDEVDMNGRKPCFRLYDSQKRDHVFKMNHDFKKISTQDLHPFHRFVFHEMTKEDFLFQRWIIEDSQTAIIARETVMKVLFLCYALQHQECYHCKSKDSLRFSEESSMSWNDMLCTECFSLYEVKTLRDTRSIDESYLSNKFSCGSWEQYCRLKNSGYSNMYLIFIPWQSAEDTYPVFVTRVHRVLPQICHATFNQNLHGIRLNTVVNVFPVMKQKWFDLPKPKSSIDVGSIGKKVFIERFSKDSYDYYHSFYFGGSDDSEPEVESCKDNDTLAVVSEEVTRPRSNDRDVSDVSRLLQQWKSKLSD